MLIKNLGCFNIEFEIPQGNPSTYSYLWDFGDGTTGTDPKHTYSSAGTYMVTMTIQTAPNCTVTHSQEIVVSPMLPINKNYTYTINADCSVSFTGPTGNPSNTTYSWDFGDNTTSTDQNPTHTYTDNGNYSVVLTVTDACDIEFTSTNTIEVNCNPNFTCPCIGQNAINIDAGSGTLLSTIPEFSGTTLNNTCLAINGQLIVDKNYNIYFGEIKMQPGSEIIVKNGKQLRLGWVAQSEGVHGCEQMWKGITVEGNARLLMTSTLIKDAQYAIKALDNSNLALANNTFDRNYVGIYTPKLSSNGFEQTINQIYAMFGNTFTCTGSNCHLLPGYQGQSPQPGTLPYAGIEINNAFFTIGRKNAPYSANYFSNMHNGVVGNKSFISSYYAEMNDMHPFSDQTNGCGFKGRRSFIVSNHSSISFARQGIESLSDYYIQSKNDNISNVTIGVDVEGVWLSPVIEDDRIIDFSYAGIDLSYPKYQLSSSIQRNYLQGEHHFGMKFTGIPYGKNLAYNKITDNQIIINSVGVGIEVYSSGRFGIQDNSILLSSPVDAYTIGIRLHDARYNYIHGNTMTRSGTDLDGSGLQMEQSPNNTICNNTTTGWYFGNLFSGGCANTGFKFNQIGQNVRGVWINPSTNIGKQIHHGNNWSQAGYRSAYHLDTNVPIKKLSQFQIKTCDAPLWPDDIYPVQGCETSTSDDWFFKKPKEPGMFVTCDPIFNFKNHPLDEEHIRENDISLVNGEFKNTQYGEMLNWEQSRYLYRKMYNQEDLLGVNALTDEFFFDHEETPLGTLVEIEEQVNDAFSLPYNYYPDWGGSMDTILSILSELGLIEELLENSTSTQDSLELTNQRSSLNANIKELSLALRNKAANMDVIKAAIVNELALKNNAIQPQTEIEQLEKSLNVLYFGMLTGKEEWSIKEQAIIRDIANRCPMQFGHIVLKARGLVTLFDDKTIYDDERLCAEAQSRSYRVSSPLVKVANFEIQPNPAYDLLQVSWKKQPPRGEKVHFEIRSLDGFVMKSWLLDEVANGNHLDISTIQTGFYIARINIGNTVETQKVIILR